MALLSVDTLYTTYDTYTSADALEYAQSPSTYAEKATDSATYFTKVNSLTVGDSYGYEINLYVAATLDSGLTSGVTSTVAITVGEGADSFPSSRCEIEKIHSPRAANTRSSSECKVLLQDNQRIGGTLESLSHLQ